MGMGKMLLGLFAVETGLEMNLVWSEPSSRDDFEAGSCRVAANTSQHCWGGTACCQISARQASDCTDTHICMQAARSSAERML